MYIVGAVVISALACQSEGPWFDLAIGQKFFRLTGTEVNPA